MKKRPKIGTKLKALIKLFWFTKIYPFFFFEFLLLMGGWAMARLANILNDDLKIAASNPCYFKLDRIKKVEKKGYF